MNDFVRVASAVINTTVADTKKNVEEHIKMMKMADREILRSKHQKQESRKALVW